MKMNAMSATIERQIWSRFRTRTFWISSTLPVVIVGIMLFQTARTTQSPSSTMFLVVLSALWIGGSSCVREIVDERKLVQRDPHLSLLAYGAAKILHAGLLAAMQAAILTALLQLSGILMIPMFSLWFIVFLTTMSGAMLALLLSALCDEPATALAWFPLLLVPQVVFGGFLFNYAPATPFYWSGEVGQEASVMPQELRRPPVEQMGIRALGALCVSRWALEAYAAEAVEQDLQNRSQFENAAKVAGFTPLTLVEEPVSDTLLQYVDGASRGKVTAPPRISAHSSQYLLILVLFVAVQAACLVVLLPLRDPRRGT